MAAVRALGGNGGGDKKNPIRNKDITVKAIRKKES